MVIAIEVIYNMGGPELILANNDGWTLKTKDNSLAGLFERTVVITANGPQILTQ
jgi:methionyl aminopeptidase